MREGAGRRKGESEEREEKGDVGKMRQRAGEKGERVGRVWEESSNCREGVG